MATRMELVEINPDRPPRARIVWLHGLGADGHDLAPMIPELDLPPSLAIRHLLPHAPHRLVTLHGGTVLRAWYDLYGLTLTAPQDAAGLETARLALEALLLADEQRTGSLPTVLAGFSQGGALALYTGLLTEQPLAGLAVLSGYLPPVPRLAAPRNLALPVWMAHGARDGVIPLAAAQRSAERLRAWGCPLTWRVYPHEHSISWQELQDLREFLLRVLGSGTG